MGLGQKQLFVQADTPRSAIIRITSSKSLNCNPHLFCQPSPSSPPAPRFMHRRTCTPRNYYYRAHVRSIIDLELTACVQVTHAFI